MAARKKSLKSGLKRPAAKKKAGRKSTAKSAHVSAKHKRAPAFGSPEGHVYVVAGPGERPRQVHVAKKATAREISRSIGLSNRQLSGARSLLATLERAGLIRKL